MRFLDREHFTPHFLSVKRQGTVTGAVATLLGTLLGEEYFCFASVFIINQVKLSLRLSTSSSLSKHKLLETIATTDSAMMAAEG